MLKRIWHAITGDHKWIEQNARHFQGKGYWTVPRDGHEYRQAYGFVQKNWLCDCGAQRMREILGCPAEPKVRDELAELRKMTGLQ